MLKQGGMVIFWRLASFEGGVHAGGRLMSFLIRSACDADAPVLAEIFRAARAGAFFWAEAEGFFLSDFAEQTRGEVIHVAEAPDGRIAGFVSVWVPDRFVHHLFIAPEFQRQGAGRLLLRSLDAWLPRPHQLKCVLANRKALAFYHALGWREIGRGGLESGGYAVMELAREAGERYLSADDPRD